MTSSTLLSQSAGTLIIMCQAAVLPGTGMVHSITKCTIDVFRLSAELIDTLVSTSQSSTLLLEVGHAYCWQGRSLMMLSGVVVDLVNGNSCVMNVGFDRLLVNDRLDGLVYVVVDVLAGNGRCVDRCVLSWLTYGLVLELSSRGGDLLLGVLVVTVIVSAVLYRDQVVVVLFWKNFLMLDRLDRCVIVILVNLLVDSDLSLLPALLVDSLVCDMGSDRLVYRGIVVTTFGHEVGNGCLCFIHVE